MWINALVSGAGGDIVKDTEKGADATIDIDADAGTDAAAVIEELAASEAAPADLSVSNEGTAGTDLRRSDEGAFMVNWTYILHNYERRDRRSPRTSATRRYPADGRGRGVAAAVRRDRHRRQQVLRARGAGHPGARLPDHPGEPGRQRRAHRQHAVQRGGLRLPALKEIYPRDLLALFQESLERGRARAR